VVFLLYCSRLASRSASVIFLLYCSLLASRSASVVFLLYCSLLASRSASVVFLLYCSLLASRSASVVFLLRFFCLLFFDASFSRLVCFFLFFHVPTVRFLCMQWSIDQTTDSLLILQPSLPRRSLDLGHSYRLLNWRILLHRIAREPGVTFGEQVCRKNRESVGLLLELNSKLIQFWFMGDGEGRRYWGSISLNSILNHTWFTFCLIVA